MTGVQPAHLAWGASTRESYININCTMIDPATGLLDEGLNYGRPSDKTVALVNFKPFW
jgi:hypothetical protein